MIGLKKIYCRVFQFAFRAAMPFLPYRQPEIFASIRELENLFKKKQVKSVLLVTDGQLRNAGVTKNLEALLEKIGVHCAVYDGTRPNPTVHNVEEARELYVQENCEALIAIPTTAGTGSEVTVTAVITDSEKKHKYTMNNFTLIPRYAVLDPEVTYSLPPSLTATTGMDALTHAVEAYIGRSTTRETRKLAKEAVKLIFENIETAYMDGKNKKAREKMLWAAYVAGVAFSKSYVGYIHAVAHSLGGQYNIPHGLANSVLMPIVLEDYGETVYKKLYDLGLVAGVVSKKDTFKSGAEKFISAIYELNRKMNIAKTFSEIKEEDIPKMAKHADKEANPLYPVPKLMNAKELEKFYYMVQGGGK